MGLFPRQPCCYRIASITNRLLRNPLPPPTSHRSRCRLRGTSLHAATFGPRARIPSFWCSIDRDVRIIKVPNRSVPREATAGPSPQADLHSPTAFPLPRPATPSRPFTLNTRTNAPATPPTTSTSNLSRSSRATPAGAAATSPCALHQILPRGKVKVKVRAKATTTSLSATATATSSSSTTRREVASETRTAVDPLGRLTLLVVDHPTLQRSRMAEEDQLSNRAEHRLNPLARPLPC